MSTPIKNRLIIYLLLAVFSAPFIGAEEAPLFVGRLQSETEHFVFIYEPKDSESAAYLASIAEDVYARVAVLFGSYPDIVYCVVNGRASIYENSFYPIPAHINITVSAPTWPLFGPRSENWLELAFTHELTHNVQIAFEDGPLAAASRIFGPGIKTGSGAFLPSWLVEGSAVLAETIFTSGGRGDNQFFEMLSKAMIVEQDFFSYRQAGSTTVFAPQQRPYVAGYLLANFIYEKYGPEAIGEIQKSYVSFPLFGPDRAIREVTGQSGQSLFGEMSAELRERYIDDLAIKSGTRITPDTYGNYYHPLHTSSGIILYRSNLNHPVSLVRFDPVTGTEEVLHVGALTDPSSFAANTDGSIIAFTSPSEDLHPAGTSGYSDLFILDKNSSRPRKITQNDHVWHPALHPSYSTQSGRVITVRANGSESYLVEIDPASGIIKLLFLLPGSTVYNPSFSEDGSMLLFALNQRGTQDIWALPYPQRTADINRTRLELPFNVDNARLITGTDTHGDFFPHMEGTDVIFSSDRSGSLALYRTDISGSGDAFLVADDPIGVYTGFIDNDQVYYGTYTAKGFAVKKKSLTEPKSLPKITTANVNSMEPMPPIGIPPLETRIYRDSPKLVFWLPLPVYYDPYAPNSLRLGAGAYIYAGSILGNTNIRLTATMDLDNYQPGLDFRGESKIGLGGISYGLFHGFHQLAESVYSQDSQISIQFSYPILSDYFYPSGFSLSAFSSVDFSARINGPEPFPFFMPTPDGLLTHSLRAEAGASIAAFRNGARRDYFSPFIFTAAGAAGVTLPLPDLQSPTLSFRVNSYLQFPSLINHQVVGLGVK
ncbi:MAG: hypothetical protein HN368_17240, partial [Spirochaetales bacterium]|nr:hypothetical protein [Spirochaetales bacterium]